MSAARAKETLPGTLSRDRFDAVLFDLDGVLTDTAKVHSTCWKRMFDQFLRERAAEAGEPFRPFDIGTEYLAYVDGKLRQDGVRDFLGSRGIELPEGSADDPPGRETVRGLGNRKDEMFNEVLKADGVDRYEGSVALLREVRSQGIKTAVVSASRNCKTVLESAEIAELFDARVDGLVAAELQLPGKPAPDTFLEAARRLAVEPKRAAVIEDAISGVQAGRDGGFGLVIGVARHVNAEELRSHGAHLVVSDLAELLDS